MSANDWSDDDAAEAVVSLAWMFFGIPMLFFVIWLLWGAR